jgi:hypothetical protein
MEPERKAKPPEPIDDAEEEHDDSPPEVND